MNESQPPDPSRQIADDQPAHLRPTGPSAVELAARQGIGPLSPLGQRVWHGQARPCVSCGQLVRRSREVCGHCGQELSADMLQKMARHGGPWYVLEHVRPFPGVSLERLVRQIRRGVLTRTTVVRGPTTYHQWRFAAETPVLSRLLGCCWQCQAEVGEADRVCPGCRTDLDAGFTGQDTPAAARSDERPGELDKLSAALGAVPTAARTRPTQGAPPTVGRIRVSWIVAAMLVLIATAVFVLVRVRAGTPASTPPAGGNKVVVPDRLRVAPASAGDRSARQPDTQPGT